MTRPTTLTRAFGRTVTECVLGGLFFGGIFGAAVGVVFSFAAGADLGAEGLGATAALMVLGTPMFAFIGCLVGIALGLGYGLAIGLGTGFAMAAAAANGRAPLPVGHLRLVAATAAASSTLLGTVGVMLLNGGGQASFSDDLRQALTVLTLFMLAPGAIAVGFAAWRSPGWAPQVDDVVGQSRG